MSTLNLGDKQLSQALRAACSDTYLEFAEPNGEEDLLSRIRNCITNFLESSDSESRNHTIKMAIVMSMAAIPTILHFHPEELERCQLVLGQLYGGLEVKKIESYTCDSYLNGIGKKGAHTPANEAFQILAYSLRILNIDNYEESLLWIMDSAFCNEGLTPVPRMARRYFNWWLQDVIPNLTLGKWPKYICTYDGIKEFEYDI